MFFMRRKTEVRKYTGHVSIHRHVLASGIVELDKMYRKITDNGRLDHLVLGFTADSVKIAMAEEPLGVKPRDQCLPGDFHLEDECHPRGKTVQQLLEPFEKLKMGWNRKWSKINKQDIALDKGCAIVGAGGCGKSTKLKELIKTVHSRGLKYAIFTFTCASRHNVSCDLSEEQAKNAYTFAAYFSDKKAERDTITKAAKLDYFFIDEFSAVPEKYMHLIFQVKLANPDIKIFIAGDKNQCPPNEALWVFYYKCLLFRHLVDYRMSEFPFIAATGRYDATTHLSLTHSTDTATIHSTLRDNGLKDTYFHLCISDKIRTMVNQTESARWDEEFSERPVSRIKGKTYAKGKPIISCIYLKSKGICNSNHFTFVKSNATTVWLKQRDSGDICQVPKELFNGYTDRTPNFRYGFCESVMRTQGITVTGEYNLHEVEKMNRQQFITAVGRCKSQEQIGIDVQDWDMTFQWKRPSSKPSKAVLKKPNLQDAIIYEILGSDGNMYRGYTTTTIEQRYLEHHQESVSPKMKKWLKERDTDIRKLLSFRYIDEDEVLAVEKEYIQRIPFQKCMNSQHVAKDPSKQTTGSYVLAAGPPKPKRKLKRPTPSDRSKLKKYARNDWKVQVKGVASYFAFRKDDPDSKARAMMDAQGYISSLGYEQ
jgi:predicted GIY-YIG superfamily endonuclease